MENKGKEKRNWGKLQEILEKKARKTERREEECYLKENARRGKKFDGGE